MALMKVRCIIRSIEQSMQFTQTKKVSPMTPSPFELVSLPMSMAHSQTIGLAACG
jgi:hypothetical protein